MPSTRPANKKKQPKTSAKRSAAPQESSNSASPMNRDRLRRLYALMLECRMVSERCAALFGSEAATRTGYEAAEVGACIHLGTDDRISPTSSLINGYINKGASLVDIFGLLKPSSGSQLASLSMSAESQILASTTVAVSRKLDGKPIVHMTILGSDGKIENASRDFWKHAVEFAGQHRLGLVYVICTPANSDFDLRAGALSIQVPGITVDGNDVVAVYRVAEESVRRAREGHGPTLIECKIDPSRDPLTFMEGYLKKRNLWSDNWHSTVLSKIQKQLDAAEKSLTEAK